MPKWMYSLNLSQVDQFDSAVFEASDNNSREIQQKSRAGFEPGMQGPPSPESCTGSGYRG